MFLKLRSIARDIPTAIVVATVLEISAMPRSSYAGPLANPLPVPCSTGTCGNVTTWVTSGSATGISTGNSLLINQASDRAIFNWRNFNIDEGYSVEFKQPNSTSIALNRIFQGDPSYILGTLKANGQVYLINQNGFLFGDKSVVNVGGLLASTLAFNSNVYGTDNDLSVLNNDKGLLYAASQGAPVLSQSGNTASIVIQSGAQLTTNAAGQRILLAASKIENGGSINAQGGGQVILAAGDQVYLQASQDPNIRGLLVEVNGDGSVHNTGAVTAEHGNITAVGLAINQDGRMTATTSVSENGSIRLLARNSVQVNNQGSAPVPQPHKGGQLTLSANSVTEVRPDTDGTTAVDEQKQSLSTIELSGQSIHFAGGSQVLAPGGSLSVLAASDPTDAVATAARPNDPNAHIRIDSGAIIDLSGSSADASVTRNLVQVELRANELADSPQQRNGALRGQTVVVDAGYITANGNVGTDLADVSGAVALIGRDVRERTSVGGTAKFDSSGDIVVADHARIDVSGGVVNYAGATTGTTMLIKADGSTVDIGHANKNDTYIGLINPVYKLVSDRWGVVKLIAAPGTGTYTSGYVQGANAGSIQFEGAAMILNGDFVGNVVNGPYQRTSSTMAQGGTFIIGDPTNAVNARAPEIDLLAQRVPSVVSEDSSIPLGVPTSLAVDTVTSGGFSRLQIVSNSTVSLASDASLVLPAGGTFSASAQHVEIDGDVVIPSGTIALTSKFLSGSPISSLGITVGDGSALDVRGLWVNDTGVPLDVLPTGLTLTNGGSIKLTQQVSGGTLSIGDDVQLRASGGAWLQRSGVAVGGTGGNISIASARTLDTTDGFTLEKNRHQTVSLGRAIEMDAFGVQGATGGSFSLTVPRIDIGAGEQAWSDTQTVKTDTGTVELGAGIFSNYGFSKVTLTADGLPLTADATKTTFDVKAGTDIDLSMKTLMLSDNMPQFVSGLGVDGFSSAQLLPEFQRKAVTANLQALTRLPASDEHQYGGLTVEKGVNIVATAGSTLNAAALGNVLFDGSVRIPSGTVQLSVAAPSDTTYIAERQLTIGGDALIDVSGTTIYQPNDSGLLTGSVLPGGSVSLIAGRGSLLTEAGSQINFSGTQGILDLQTSGATPTLTRKNIATDGGSLLLQAEESIILNGDYVGRGGVGDAGSAVGGTLAVTLDRQLPDGNSLPQYPRKAHEIRITSGQTIATVPTVGLALLDINKFNGSGVDSLVLRADDAISLDAGASLVVARGLTLNAPGIKVNEGSANITAAYISLGNATSGLQAILPVSASGGSGTLELNAQQIDVKAATYLQNIHHATIRSSGDITFIGTGTSGMLSAGDPNNPTDVDFRAARIFPATGVAFTITDYNGTVSFHQEGSSPGVPLSAAGSLTVNATDIVQSGTVLAPFGTINLNATESLSFTNGSYTSVSGAKAVIPYGRVDNGTSWVYGPTLISEQPVLQTPSDRVSLNGSTVDIGTGAVIDVSGGGDLYAYQWTPGTGGKSDALAGTASGMYAILPAIQGQGTPYDQMIWANSGVTRGQSIYLAGGGGLAAGVYQLLPARYALLPGAYLVSATKGFQDLVPGQTGSTADGATVVAGYATFGSQVNPAARYSGFVIRPGSYARSLSQYDDRFASQFFTAASSTTATNPRLPQDAGTLAIQVQQSFAATGNVLGAGAASGHNATVEISTPLAIDVESTVGTPTSNTIRLSSDQLQGWHIGSLLLGGTRDNSGNINVSSSSITIGNGANVTADEVVLVAAQGITVAEGATVDTRSGTNANGTLDDVLFADTTPLTLSGTNSTNAAVLAISDLAYLEVARSGARVGSASVNVNSGAHVGTRGAIAVDAPGAITISPNTLAATGASWSLGAQHVAFGAANSAPDGLAIDLSDANLLTSLQNARALRIDSTGALDLMNVVTLSSKNSIALTAASINLNGSGTSQFSADTITLAGKNAISGNVTSGSASLVFQAREIDLGNNVLGISGAADVTLNASGRVMGVGTGGLNVSGDLTLNSAVVSVAGGKITQLAANQGTVLLQSVGAAPAASTLPLGGTLEIDAKNIADSGNTILPGGVVKLSASEGLSLGDGALIDVSSYIPVTAQSGPKGGSINLSAAAVTMNSGATLRVAGAQSDAGSINIVTTGDASLQGTFVETTSQGFDGGMFALQAATLNGGSAGAFDDLAARISGFSAQQVVHVASGDLNVGASTTVTAREIELTTDSGGITISGSLQAVSGEQRSSISLNAYNDIVLGSTSVLNASASDATTYRGGRIELAVMSTGAGTSGGHIKIDPSATIRAQGVNNSGELVLRAPISSTDFNVDALPGDLSHIDSVILEPVVPYQLSGTLDAGTANQIFTVVKSYFDGAQANIRNRLGNDAVIRPFVDITNNGDLEIKSVDFSDSIDSSNPSWRFAGQPAVVSIRAAGNIVVSTPDPTYQFEPNTAAFSDGFIETFTFNGNMLDLLPNGSLSSSFNFVAGADLGSTSIRATSLSPAAASADFVLYSNAIVRTGTGDIYIGAARNVVFGQGSSVYTAGYQGADTTFNDDGVTSYGTNGGNILIAAGNDVVGSVVAQSVADWQPRSSYTTATGAAAAYWGIDVNAFHWNVGALAGGDVQVFAGRDAKDVTAATADSLALGLNGQDRIELGGGNLSVIAGRDISSGMFYVGQGTGAIRALGDLNASGNRRDAQQNDIGTLLLAGDASFDLSAIGDVLFEGELQPTTFVPSRFNDAFVYFSRYSESSDLQIASAGGSVVYNSRRSRAGAYIRFDPNTSEAVFEFAPPSVEIAAYGGDLDMNDGLKLVPSSNGNISLYASRDMTGNVAMRENSLASVPSPTNVYQTDTRFESALLRAGSVLHINDVTPAFISAGRDLIGMGIDIPKSVQIQAGRDITNLSLANFNVSPTDITLVKAGRDITYSEDLLHLSAGIKTGGPGLLEVLADGKIALGFSDGITTTGNLNNSNLPSDTGADILAIAGLSAPVGVGQTAQSQDFISQIIAASSSEQSSLIDYVKQQTGLAPSDFASAADTFRSLSLIQQLPFLSQVLFTELVKSGREANANPSIGFKNGFAALESLFPNSHTPGVDNPYSGDISLPFSRIYTLAGGSISLLAPGGKIDVGLANPPGNLVQLGFNKQAYQLGIVAQKQGSVDIFTQGDVNVNSSRVFTLGGGDIAIWSSEGNIDAGRGAKSAISAPPPTLLIDSQGNVTLDVRGTVAGSGIRTILAVEGAPPGNVDLMAPAGFVNAGDAGIGSAGNLNIAAQHVIGVDNIQVGGTATGVPPETSGLGVSLSAASTAGASSSNSANSALSDDKKKEEQAPIAQSALSWLEVFVVGLGEDTCKQDDMECLRRQAPK